MIKNKNNRSAKQLKETMSFLKHNTTTIHGIIKTIKKNKLRISLK